MLEKVRSKEKFPVITNDGGRVTFDCGGCDGMCSLSERRCLLCVCEKVYGIGDMTSLKMRSFMDTAYDGEAAMYIRELASVYGLMKINPTDRRGRKCRYCKKSFTNLIRDQIAGFPDFDSVLLTGRAKQIVVNNDVCNICISDSIRMFRHIDIAIRDIQTKIGNTYGRRE